jgi:hypothetical protein
MSIMDKILGAMTDDKGLFQGGEHGRMFGRLQDALGVPGQKTSPYSTQEARDKAWSEDSTRVDAVSRTESLEELPTKFTRTNPYGHRLDEIDMGDKTPYEYLIENPGDLRSYINRLGHYGKGGSTDKQNMFIKLFGTQEGGEALLNQYYHDASEVQQSFVKGAELQNNIQNALNKKGVSVLDLVGDVHFGRTGPVREGEFERGLKYGEDFQKALSSDSRFPDPDAGAVYNKDPRIENAGYEYEK